MDDDRAVWRAKADVTQAELADAIGVSRQTIDAIESGRYDPSLELAVQLATYFECWIEEIFDPEGAEP